MNAPSIKRSGTTGLFVLATMVFTVSLSFVSALAAPPPVFVAGAQNITCSELRDTNPGGQFGHLVEAWEFKVDTPPNGVNTFRLDGTDGGILTMPPNSNMWITYDRTSATSIGSWNLTWTSTSAIDRLVSALIIKGGANGKNIYPYNPLASSDIGPFITPGQTNAISHISFCFEPPPAQIQGFKFVSLGTEPGDDLNGNGVINVGDTVRWVAVYVNTGSVSVTNFQITDTVPSNTTYVNTPNPQPVVLGNSVGATAASANLSYNGSGNLLAPGATLDVGGAIAVAIRTKININACFGGCQPILNQAFATGDGVPNPVPTDALDNTHTTQPPNNPPLTPGPTSVTQDEDPNIIPTRVLLAVPTAADVFLEGRTVGTNGRGLSGINVTLTDINTGQRRTAVTNTFGYFKFEDLEIGDVFILSAFNKRYTFEEQTIVLNDNVTGVTLVGTPR